MSGIFSDKSDFTDQLLQALASGNLLKPKHSLSSLGTSEPHYRTVVVHDEPALRSFFESGSYSVTSYKNNDPRHTDPYYVVTPDDRNVVAASGVPANVPDPSHPCDIFIVVSGSSQGLHIYGESSSTIQAKVNAGTLDYLSDLT